MSGLPNNELKVLKGKSNTKKIMKACWDLENTISNPLFLSLFFEILPPSSSRFIMTLLLASETNRGKLCVRESEWERKRDLSFCLKRLFRRKGVVASNRRCITFNAWCETCVCVCVCVCARLCVRVCVLCVWESVLRKIRAQTVFYKVSPKSKTR